MSNILQIGDPVIVHDELLILLANIANLPPRNKGWVYGFDDDDILVEFPIGDDDPDEHSQVAPYPANEVFFNPDGEKRSED